MKNFKTTTIIALLLLIGLQSCKESSHQPDSMKIVSVGYASDKFLEEQYKGKIGEFSIRIVSQNIELDAQGNAISGTGREINLSIFDNFNVRDLPEGTFSFSETVGEKNALKGYYKVTEYEASEYYPAYTDSVIMGSIAYDITDGKTDYDHPKFLKGGTMTISKTNEEYRIDITTIINEQEEKIVAIGNLSKSDINNIAYPLEPLEKTVEQHTMTSINYRTAFGYVEGNEYYASFFNPSEMLQCDIDLFVEAENMSLEKFPTGSFAINLSLEPNTAISGGYMGDFGGSFLAKMDEMDEFTKVWYLSDGTIVVTKNTEEYSVDINAISALGSTIKITYTGAIPVEEITPPEF